MTKAHVLGYPRIGAKRELKFALEKYWRGDIGAAELEQVAAQIRLANWREQADAGLDWVSVGDFSLYDHVLDTSLLFGTIPSRFGVAKFDADSELDIYFRMARGRACVGDAKETYACEMTKWFDTNYHYLKPEIGPEQQFSLHPRRLLSQVKQALASGFTPKPVLLGPLSFLWLAKTSVEFDRLNLLPNLVPVYQELLQQLRELGVEWVQIDEPVLVLNLPKAWQQAYETVYDQLSAGNPKLMLTTYFEALGDNLTLAANLPVAGLHIDCVRAPDQLEDILPHTPPYKILSLGLVDGRNIWRSDFDHALSLLRQAKDLLGQRLWVGSSCSLLHSPVDLAGETQLDPELFCWLGFAKQKLGEVKLLAIALSDGEEAVANAFAEQRSALAARKRSTLVVNKQIRAAVAEIPDQALRRQNGFNKRAALQRQRLKLPLWPTTTIGSFPQTDSIRRTRSQYRSRQIDDDQYQTAMQQEIANTIAQQEQLGLDVLVHGEAERNDMVEYFGEFLQGIAVTLNGWVQSYGSRCVKPPIIYGDIVRDKPMTVKWAQYAQSLSTKPVKGMLTGPVTILQWSFVRNDQDRSQTCRQIAFALRQEVLDLESAGITIIQVDEPALREGLPLHRDDWDAYLKWAVDAFKLATCGVQDATQIHTHMCYAEFNDILRHIAALDADVITLETSRSRMELLQAFHDYEYPNDIGPGVYDIHSPRTPAVSEMITLLAKAARSIPAQRLWVNPDCGLKTRSWPEVEAALKNMVSAAKQLRATAMPKVSALLE